MKVVRISFVFRSNVSRVQINEEDNFENPFFITLNSFAADEGKCTQTIWQSRKAAFESVRLFLFTEICYFVCNLIEDERVCISELL